MTRDSEAFDEFYRATSRRLVHYAYAMAGDQGSAQDLAHEAYIRAWRQWSHVASLDRPEQWLRVVVTRLATDRWRRLRTAQRIAQTYLSPRTTPPPSEDSVVLVSALRQLPRQQRRAICLFYLCDMPVARIAEEAGVAEGTVKSWLSRGRAALAGILGADPSIDTGGELTVATIGPEVHDA